MKIKKIWLLILLLLTTIVLNGCGLFGGKNDTVDYFENFDKINEEKQQFYNTTLGKITNEDQKNAFSIDYLTIGGADIVTSMYISIVTLYETTPILVPKDIKKDKDTYTIKDGDDLVKVRYDQGTKSTQVQFYEKEVLVYEIETTELKDGGYAYKLYSFNDGKKTIVEYYLKNDNGRLCIKENVNDKGESIYKKSSVSSSFAQNGTRVYILNNNTFSFEGTLPNPNDDKTVTSFTIKSGFKTQYLTGETIDITNMVIEVNYSDSTKKSVNVTSAMLSGDAPSTSTTGSKSFKLIYGNHTETFTYLVTNVNLVVKTFTVKSGLKPSYEINEELDITKILLEVEYDNNTKQDIYVTLAMILGDLPNTTTPGDKSLIIKLGDVQKNFTYKVSSANLSLEQKLYMSFENFYKTLYLDINSSFIKKYTLSINLLEEEPKNFYNYEFLGQVTDKWGAVILAMEAISAIDAYGEGIFEQMYPTPNNDYNKNNFINYDGENQKYNLGLWLTKGLSTYWFEFAIYYLEETDSFKMNIKSGIGENQLDRGTMEYVKIEDGNYALSIHYLDESYETKEYSHLQFKFTKDDGIIVINYLVNEKPTSIYKQTNLAEFATSGDKVLTFVNTDNITFKNNIRSKAWQFFESFLRGNKINYYGYEGSLENTYLSIVEALDEEWLFNRTKFSINENNFSNIMEIVRDYEEKKFTTKYNIAQFEVIKNGDLITLKVTTKYETFTYKVRYVDNKLVIEYNNERDAFERAELIKVGTTYYVQIILKYSYLEDYIVSRAKYTDNANMEFSYSEKIENLPLSIFSSIPTDFLKDGEEKFIIKDNEYTHLKKYAINISPNNEIDEYILYTDLYGKLTLPNVSYSGYEFLGWYMDGEYIGKGGSIYTFTSDSYIYAEFE